MKKESLKTNHYHHLTSGERIRISEMLYKGESLRTIADVLGKSTSTISREIKKTFGSNTYKEK